MECVSLMGGQRPVRWRQRRRGCERRRRRRRRHRQGLRRAALSRPAASRWRRGTGRPGPGGGRAPARKAPAGGRPKGREAGTGGAEAGGDGEEVARAARHVALPVAPPKLQLVARHPDAPPPEDPHQLQRPRVLERPPPLEVALRLPRVVLARLVRQLLVAEGHRPQRHQRRRPDRKRRRVER
eukprot:1003816-Rhodomonas_salina.1